MKKLMNRAWLLAAAFALALAVALALNAAGQTPAVAQIPAPTQTPTATQTPEAGANASARGSDTDGNGLIEITTHAQLNAMRYDLDGDGVMDYDLNDDGIPDVSAADRVTLDNLFDCPPTTAECKGYELKSDISLASYQNWEPIGAWQAVFNGNGFSITGLKGNKGLFSVIGDGGGNAANINDATVVRNVDVVGADITLCVGALATVNHATIIGSYVTGKITCSATAFGEVGGLVAANRGTIIASVADVDVKVTDIPADARMRVGGFAGMNYGDIHRSYAYGNVRDARSTTVRNARPRAFKASGFANNYLSKGGTIHSSFSYGDKIVTHGDGESAIVDSINSKYPAVFAHGLNSNSDSCALADEWEFTCPTPTPTSTPTN